MAPSSWSGRVVHFVAAAVLAAAAAAAAEEADETPGKLEIHYINVGQGGATLIRGPNGTRVLYDFGNVSGRKYILPYLQDLGITPEEGLDYAIVSHRDRDHYTGYKALIEAGYQVYVANYGSGSDKTSSTADEWLEKAKETLAGPVRPIPVGLRIALGDGAELVVVAANGRVWHTKAPDVPNENDRSVVLFIKYDQFDYILDGDLGAGPEDCTDHQTPQMDLQTVVARALINNKLIDEATGVDVMHVAHHGSESSTSSEYYNLVKPEVAVISVGPNQGRFRHPREDVVDRVLLGPERPECVQAPPVDCLFQTDDGVEGETATGRTSFSGLAVGNIVIETDGKTEYWVYGDGKLAQGNGEVGPTPDRCGEHFSQNQGKPGWRFVLAP